MMAKGLIGKKIGMTQIFDAETKEAIPVTVVEVGPCTVTQIKTEEVDGYCAAQVGYLEQKPQRVTKPQMGHFQKAGTGAFKVLKEFSVPSAECKVGDVLTLDLFQEIEKLDVTGVTKGRGFQGVVKRHGFAGVGQATHGQHNRLRAPGSIGAASYPARVFKGMKMAGRMGAEKVKVMNLRVLKVMPEKNILLVKGAVPGHNNSYLLIQK